MLNISTNQPSSSPELLEFVNDSTSVLPRANLLFRRWLVGMLILFLVFMFLPWTQNVQSDGNITTLLPEDRPQTIQSAISGRVERWLVREGQLVQAGDTIVQISEIKAEYLDPQLVDRTIAQRNAKGGSAENYLAKAAALATQITTLSDQLLLKQQQMDQKIRQTELKINTQLANIVNEQTQVQIAIIQYNRSDSLFALGIHPRSKFEDATNKLRSAEAKLTSETNKLAEMRNELQIVRLERRNNENETREKIAKAESERAASLSSYYAAVGDTENSPMK
ncbi:MAG: biotin/lipoyl-binding protein [Lewinella sp.]|nr:biotin/lipoyl-binding protein [Lewinella sp.]